MVKPTGMTNRKYEKIQKKFQQSPYRITEKASKSVINNDFEQNEIEKLNQNLEINDYNKPLVKNESKKSSTADISNRKNLKLMHKINKSNNSNVSNSISSIT